MPSTSKASTAQRSPTRKDLSPLKVYALPAERQLIEQRAAMTGLSVSSYLLELGRGYQPKARVDPDQIQALIRLHAALVKTNELLAAVARDAEKVVEAEPMDVYAVIAQARDTQAIVQRLVRKAIGPVGSVSASRKPRPTSAHDREEGFHASREEVQLRRAGGLSGERSGQ